MEEKKREEKKENIRKYGTCVKDKKKDKKREKENRQKKSSALCGTF